MISQSEIQDHVKLWGLDDHVIEKDYVLGWVLWGISRHPNLSKEWLLKGGSAIKKCYVDTHRYSQDLDFTVLPDGTSDPEVLTEEFETILDDVASTSGIDFKTQEHIFNMRPHGGSCQGKIYYIGPRGNPGPTAIKLDISFSEDLMRPQVLRDIIHPYSDDMPGSVQTYCYNLEELFAEKIRALIQRSSPRDLYDIVYLFRRSDLNAEPDLIKEVLEHKCSMKDVAIPEANSYESIISKDDLKSDWEAMLRRAVAHLPSMDDYWNELPALFAWLDGEDYEVKLLPIKEEDEWQAAPVVWESGQSELIEPIRHAAVNRLLVKLGYNMKYRLVEPYSLRHSLAGNILFYAIKLPTREIRCYRIDRIQSIEITHDPYDPVFAIEFIRKGRIPVPLTRRRRRFSSNSYKRQYTIECSVCGKRFSRSKYNTRINPHKHKDYGSKCYGTYGYLV